jgi:RimJ/RimL family protein N-acetyltransferase
MTSTATRIRTDRVVLTALAVTDATEMVQVLADRALYTFTGGEAPTVAELTSRYEHQVAGSGRRDETWHNWIVRVPPDDVAIGYVQATVTGTAADIAWVIGTHWQGKGLATDATRAMVGWLRARGTTRITAHIHPEHRSSEKVATKVGMTLTDEVDADGERLWATALA